MVRASSLLLSAITQSEAVSTVLIFCDIESLTWYGRIYGRIWVREIRNRAFMEEIDVNIICKLP